MRARAVPEADLEGLLDPDSGGWARADVATLKLEGTPLGLQPTGLIRAAWADRKIGAVDRARVAAVHDGRRLAFRLEWSDPSEDRVLGDNDSFPDAAAVVLPAREKAPLVTMGAPGLAVNAWYWRADDAHARNVVAEGLGSSRSVDATPVQARGVWREGRWRVVIARALRVDTALPLAQLDPGEATGFGVAVWDGGSAERAGIKAYSGPRWLELRLDDLPEAGR
ncbi:MAG: ethylbenzene dehydrogenase-related protein [Myxococcota bacterium]